MNTINCTLRFNYDSDVGARKIIAVGYKLLEKRGIVKVRKIENKSDFRADGYSHNDIVEVEADGLRLAYDLADGYQSFHRMAAFDALLNSVDFYFKFSCRADMHNEMRNKGKIYPMSTSVYTTCKGNPVDSPFFNRHGFVDYLRAIYHLPDKLKYNRENTIERLTSHNTFDSYRPLYWTRVWNPETPSPEFLQKAYPYFSHEESVAESEKIKDMIDSINTERIEVARKMKAHFGSDFIFGIAANEASQRLCPDLVVSNPLVDTRNAYMHTIRSGVVCVLTPGLHRCTGAKMAECLCAGRAFLSEEMCYDMEHPVLPGENFALYDGVDDLVQKAALLLVDVDKIKKMEDANHECFVNFYTPEKVVLASLQKVFPQLNTAL